MFSAGSGHSDGGIQTATGAFVLFVLMVLILATGYLSYMVYYRNKLLQKNFVEKEAEYK